MLDLYGPGGVPWVTPVKPARIVVRDSPWGDYGDRREYRKDNAAWKTKFGIGAENNYGHGVAKVPKLAEIKPYLDSVTTKDAYLFDWVTAPMLPQALELIRLCGFVYKTIAFNWIKTNCKSGTAFNGAGRYTFSNIEFLVISRRKGAKCWHPAKGYKPSQVLPEIFEEVGEDEWEQYTVACPHPRVNNKIRHSQKPEIFQELIEKWLGPHIGDHSMLELYARRERPGWICLGGDISGNDICEDLTKLNQRIFLEGYSKPTRDPVTGIMLHGGGSGCL